MLTQSTFDVVAKVVREHAAAERYRYMEQMATGDTVEPDSLAVRFANELDCHNPRFDRNRFLSACEPTTKRSPR